MIIVPASIIDEYKIKLLLVGASTMQDTLGSIFANQTLNIGSMRIDYNYSKFIKKLRDQLGAMIS